MENETTIIESAAAKPAHVMAVYLTFPDEGTARNVSLALVERRLAACVNVLPAGSSVYRWHGDVVTESEVVAWAKTTRAKLAALANAVKQLHPYDLPAIVAYPAVGGLAGYLDWVETETA